MTPRAYFNLFLLNMITSPCVTVDNASDKTKNILSMVPNSNSNCQKMSTTDQESTQLNTETSACFAIVPYDSSALPPMHVERKEFKFAGRLLHIKQNWAELGVAAIVWDAAVVLAEYLEQHQQIASGKKIIELGAGTGLVGMVAALLGGDVTVTERGSILEYLTNVVNENFDNQESFKINVAELDWTKPLLISGAYDVILGADIVYIEEVFADLLQKFIDLSDCDTTIFLSCKIRYDRDTKYLSMMETAFNIKEIFYDIPRDIKIYKATKIC